MATMASGDTRTGMTVAQFLAKSRGTLACAGVEAAASEAIWLLESALQTTRTGLIIECARLLTPSEHTRAEGLIARRAAREPLQYILGSQEFCGLTFEVSPAVLIPRPETELLVEEARQVLTRKNAETIVDIGTGSGCLAVALASVVSTARIYAVDCSASALDVAQKNIARHSVEGQVTCALGDLCMPLESMGLVAQVDVIVSNPPYVTEAEWPHLQPEVRGFEPRRALVGGITGIEVHSRLVDQAWRYLVPGGWLFMEVGIGQSEAVCRLAAQTGRYTDSTVRRDAAGIDRIIRVQSLG